MSTVILDTITGKSTATTITIGSTPVVSASANSMTIRGEGTAQTSIQQGLTKVWHHGSSDGATLEDSFNVGSLTDTATGQQTVNLTNNMANANYSVQIGVHFAQTRFHFSQNVATSSYTASVYLADNSDYADAHQNSQVAGDLA